MLYSPQIEPITDMRRDPLSVLSKLGKGPVFLTQRSQRAAVLISSEMWDRIVEQVDNLECLVEALEVELDIAKGKSKIVNISDEQLEAWARDAELVSA